MPEVKAPNGPQARYRLTAAQIALTTLRQTCEIAVLGFALVALVAAVRIIVEFAP